MHFRIQLTVSDGITTAIKLGILFNSTVVVFLNREWKRSTPSGDGHKVGRFKRFTSIGLCTATLVTDGGLSPLSMVNDLAVIHIICDARLVALQWTAVGDDCAVMIMGNDSRCE